MYQAVRSLPAPTGWEAFFWRAFERSKNPMVILDLHRTIVAVNGGAVRLFGYAPEEVVGRRSDQLVAPTWVQRREAHWNTLLATGAVQGEREVSRKDGSTVRVQFAANREAVTGQQLILWVVLESSLNPLTAGASQRQRPGVLTPREVEVVRGLTLGKRVREVAEELVISPATAETHVRNAMGKLGARSQAQLVAISLAAGLLGADLLDVIRRAPALSELAGDQAASAA